MAPTAASHRFFLPAVGLRVGSGGRREFSSRGSPGPSVGRTLRRKFRQLPDPRATIGRSLGCPVHGTSATRPCQNRSSVPLAVREPWIVCGPKGSCPSNNLTLQFSGPSALHLDSLEEGVGSRVEGRAFVSRVEGRRGGGRCGLPSFHGFAPCVLFLRWPIRGASRFARLGETGIPAPPGRAALFPFFPMFSWALPLVRARRLWRRNGQKRLFANNPTPFSSRGRSVSVAVGGGVG